MSLILLNSFFIITPLRLAPSGFGADYFHLDVFLFVWEKELIVPGNMLII
jgi:hypothetical protein